MPKNGPEDFIQPQTIKMSCPLDRHKCEYWVSMTSVTDKTPVTGDSFRNKNHEVTILSYKRKFCNDETLEIQI